MKWTMQAQLTRRVVVRTCGPTLAGVLRGCGRGEVGAVAEGVGGGAEPLLVPTRQNQHLGQEHNDQHQRRVHSQTYKCRDRFVLRN